MVGKTDVEKADAFMKAVTSIPNKQQNQLKTR